MTSQDQLAEGQARPLRNRMPAALWLQALLQGPPPVPSPAKLVPGRGNVGHVGALKHLLALMMAAASPPLISRHFRHVERYKEAYRAGESGPEAMASIAASQRLSGRTKPTAWETQWQSHWVPPFPGSIARRDARDGMARLMRAVALQWQDLQFEKGFAESEMVAQARRILGETMDGRHWRGSCVSTA